ncbi:DNA-3-methyladenine glycosylase 2 family protein [Plectonema radiosum NIES-515]|uniref:DNA-3-methyladenine glycosylase II n=1 Tax=Plectonema radiosum NIES-515 TaxID=2986073 RepID=A0ABT3AZA6_9CYAN|nr:DNA-3-methyladenine glycosylase 2 family protein [Plectonema radiosum]MCV3214469.1 DNA-3-methyladenine glycosylase 2 family protein [Plectonema radiosum NIES-515]
MMSILSRETLTEDNFADGLNFVVSRDPDLAEIFTRFGTPPLWVREPGFSTLIQIILEQQVSLASAKAVYTRLQAAISPINPELFLQLHDVEIKQIGFSRQKTLYTRTLAQSLIAGELDLSSVTTMEDGEIRTVLKKIKGIGDWTVDIYLMMALRRPDSLPSSDLGLILAIQKVKRLEHRPKPAEIELIAEIWRPWRAVATRLLWHYYLNQPRTLT